MNCNNNFCINCLVEHRSSKKGHQIINFTDQVEKYLTKEKIEAKKKEFSQQEENINKFLVNLDEWKEILELKKRLNKIYAENTGNKLAVIEKAMDRDNFMSPEEAKSFGLIDNIVKNRLEIIK